MNPRHIAAAANTVQLQPDQMETADNTRVTRTYSIEGRDSLILPLRPPIGGPDKNLPQDYKVKTYSYQQQPGGRARLTVTGEIENKDTADTAAQTPPKDSRSLTYTTVSFPNPTYNLPFTPDEVLRVQQAFGPSADLNNTLLQQAWSDYFRAYLRGAPTLQFQCPVERYTTYRPQPQTDHGRLLAAQTGQFTAQTTTAAPQPPKPLIPRYTPALETLAPYKTIKDRSNSNGFLTFFSKEGYNLTDKGQYALAIAALNQRNAAARAAASAPTAFDQVRTFGGTGQPGPFPVLHYAPDVGGRQVTSFNADYDGAYWREEIEYTTYPAAAEIRLAARLTSGDPAFQTQFQIEATRRQAAATFAASTGRGSSNQTFDSNVRINPQTGQPFALGDRYFGPDGTLSVVSGISRAYNNTPPYTA